MMSYLLIPMSNILFSQGCPFCRAEIKGTEQIVVDAFDPKRQHNRNAMNSKQKDDDHEDDNEVL